MKLMKVGIERRTQFGNWFPNDSWAFDGIKPTFGQLLAGYRTLTLVGGFGGMRSLPVANS